MFAYFLISCLSMFTIHEQLSQASAPAKVFSVTSDSLAQSQIDSIAAKLSPVIKLETGENGPQTANEIVQYLLSFFGGLLTTIIMYFLHKWFPQVFPSRKIKDYRPKNGY